MAYKISTQGIALLQNFEGFREDAYEDVVGIWTIGYGSIRIDGKPVVRGQTITKDDAVFALIDECGSVLRYLESGIVRPLTQNQVDALVSLCYNIGIGAFSRSTLRKTINMNATVPEKMFTDWSKARKDGKLVRVEGLYRRRKAEYALFTKDI